MPPGPGDERRGGAFYDDPGVFQRYRRHREWADNPHRVMEEPALLEELGAVAGQRVLDLGCGDASIARTVLARGAVRYLGIDGSARMVAAARSGLADTAAEVRRSDIEDFDAERGAFDLVLSRMALHYVGDVGHVLRGCHRWLSDHGRVLFTVAHPVVTSHDPRATTDEPRQDWVVDDYFVPGPRDRDWLGAPSRWQHRTIEDYVRALRGAGFELLNLRECAPARERFADAAEFARRRRVPLVLLLSGARA